MDYKSNISKISNKKIVAILNLQSSVKFGKNSKGDSIYPCIPLKSDLPTFKVASKYKGQKNKIVIIQLLYWTDKLPRGMIIDVLGDVNNIDSLNRGLLHYYDILVNKPKIKKINNDQDFKYIDRTQLEIFSIDPPNCSDIDDALSCEIVKEKTIVGVHIEDLKKYLTKELILKKIKYQTSSLYPINTKPQNLWGDKITQLASLKQNQVKTSISLFFTIISNKITNVKLKFLKIIPKKSLSYNQADKLINSYLPLKNLLEISQNIYQKKINDTKELISIWMILANQYIIKKMKQNDLPIIYRIHQKTDLIENFLDSNIFEKIKYRWNPAAEYSLVKSDHESLNLKEYTHFTSPIRRITDTCLHWIIKYKINLLNQNSIDDINKKEKQIRKYHLQLELEKVVQQYDYKDNLKGYIINLSENNKMELYLEKYNKFITSKIINKAFLKNCKMNLENNHLIIKNLLNHQINIFKLGEKIEIKILTNNNFLPKYKFKIIFLNKIINSWFVL